MTSDPLTDQLNFLKEIDRLKSIVRASPVLDRTRRENSAEHSWHLAMYALVLSDYAHSSVNINRVIKMLLIHDVVEIDAGDTPIHCARETTEQAELENRAADRIFGLLPAGQCAAFRFLWNEFETAETEDAKFAKSLDCLQPPIQNVETDGGTWNEHAVTRQQVFERYGPQIENGSATLWARASFLVRDFFSKQTL